METIDKSPSVDAGSGLDRYYGEPHPVGTVAAFHFFEHMRAVELEAATRRDSSDQTPPSDPRPSQN